jgi:uncharacterized phiE125 gp8 family phage protein
MSTQRAELLTAPTIEPVTLPDLKYHLNVDGTHDDPLIVRIAQTARAYVEEHTRTKLVRQQWRVYMDYHLMETSLWPAKVQEVAQVQYVDEDGATQTVATSVYDVDIPNQRLLLAYDQTWPTTRHQRNAAWMDVWSGFYVSGNSPLDLTGNIPDDLLGAIYMLSDHMYEHRGVSVAPGFGQDPVFRALLAPHRRYER